MKAQILEKLVNGRGGVGQIIRLVFIRVFTVMAFSLVLTLIFWFFWLENYAWGAFLLGAALGLSAFQILSSLKKRWNLLGRDERLGVSEKEVNLGDPEHIKPEAPVEK